MIVPILKNVKNIIHTPFSNINFYNKATLPFIAYNIIIGPHGITDLLYAIEYKKILQFTSVYCLNSVFFRWLHIKQYESIMNAVFLSLSAIHFRNDVPINNKFIQLFFSTLFVLNLKTLGLPVFLFYMCFLHVPNHYLTYKELMSKHKYLSYLIISSVSVFLCNSQNCIENNSWLIKSIIISHILFEEIHVKQKHRNVLHHIFYNDNSKNMAIYI
jgi:hypothetical protein|tara:strand:- start:1347 stop:1991 length:645 start_codon:yes stop_codon:yes gene_type:complete